MRSIPMVYRDGASRCPACGHDLRTDYSLSFVEDAKDFDRRLNAKRSSAKPGGAAGPGPLSRQPLAPLPYYGYE